MADWLITIPKTVEWKEYEEELKVVRDGQQVLNYRVHYKPKVQMGDRVYVVWNGAIRGWMKCVGIEERKDGFKCSTTGKSWRAGWYLQRSGQFHVINPFPYKGFRGLRKFDMLKEVLTSVQQRDKDGG